MATNNPCGCTPLNSNDPSASLPVPEGTVHAYGTINCPTAPAPCYTPMCDPRFETLPRALRIELIGVSGKCLYRLDSSTPGVVCVDERGGFTVSTSPKIDLQQLVSYASGPNGLLLDASKNPIEGTPPEFPYLVVQLADGSQRKVRGRPGSIGILVWDDDGFHIKDVDEANIIISRPTGEATQIELIGFDTDDCPAEGDVNNLVRLISTEEGVAFYDPTTNKVTIKNICELFNDAGNLTGVPFLLACSGGEPTRFKGTADSVLVWTATDGAFKLVEVDSKACDPDCGCSTELSMLYDCVTGTFSITEPETHVLSFRINSDIGPNASVTFTLPWPAMLTCYAGRRFTPTNGALDVHRCDIIVDGIPATSPSDGGMVGRLDNATTNTGVAVVPVKKGSHTVYIGNSVTTNDVTPIWAGAWLKVVAHKIAECDPTRPSIGAGTIRAAYGGGEEECDCPPGPAGASGLAGPQGPQGIQGPEGTAGAVVGQCFSVNDIDAVAGDGPGKLDLYYRENEFGIEEGDDDEFAWFCRNVDEDHLIASVQQPIPPFTFPFVDNVGFETISPGVVICKIFYKNLVWDGAAFNLQTGDVGEASVPCSCTEE